MSPIAAYTKRQAVGRGVCAQVSFGMASRNRK